MVVAQACHGLMAFNVKHPVITRQWHERSSNLVVLQVPSEEALKHLADRVKAARHRCAVFREPDLDDTVTAVAIEPAGCRMVSSLPLALRRQSSPQV
jgi:peptidyl-tRNA hydrolase